MALPDGGSQMSSLHRAYMTGASAEEYSSPVFQIASSAWGYKETTPARGRAEAVLRDFDAVGGRHTLITPHPVNRSHG